MSFEPECKFQKYKIRHFERIRGFYGPGSGLKILYIDDDKTNYHTLPDKTGITFVQCIDGNINTWNWSGVARSHSPGRSHSPERLHSPSIRLRSRSSGSESSDSESSGPELTRRRSGIGRHTLNKSLFNSGSDSDDL